MDILFVSPGNASAIYQGLADEYAAIEPPTWALILAESARSWGASVGILDANAERMDPASVAERIGELRPRVVCLAVYGQNVNAGTVGMSGASAIADAVKARFPEIPVGIAGSYVQALPIKTLQDEAAIDFGFTNEGVYALRDVLNLPGLKPEQLETVRGLVLRSESGNVGMTPAADLVPTARMDVDMPGYAWDLLPFASKPLDLYRSPLWHAGYKAADRSPYAAIQTSLGCNFGCSFCMINIINRDDVQEVGVASDYRGMRFWSPEFAVRQVDQLADLGVRTIRIVDEMFLLNKKYYVPFCETLAERDYAEELRMWAYSRIDTVRDPDLLAMVRRAGIRWLALGIENADKSVRLEVSKGKFEDVDIARVVQQIHDADIDVMANYIVGLPGETAETMQATLDLSLALATSGWNMYAATPLPGSELYRKALDSGQELPSDYLDYSFHSYESSPMATETLDPADILDFRDSAFCTYHSDGAVLDRIGARFGAQARNEVADMSQYKLRRRLVDERDSISPLQERS